VFIAVPIGISAATFKIHLILFKTSNMLTVFETPACMDAEAGKRHVSGYAKESESITTEIKHSNRNETETCAET